MAMKTMTAEWARLARTDLRVAAAILGIGEAANTAYHLQQALEKALKAVLAERSPEPPPRTHNLVRLARLAEVWETLGTAQQDILVRVDPYVVEGRYGATQPQPSPPLTVADAQTLTREVGELVECLLAQLK
jgi:HEPN domain-containing protein